MRRLHRWTLFCDVFPRSLLVPAAVLLAAAGMLAGSLRAELKIPNAIDRQVALLVTRQLEGQHLSRRLVNDEISSRALETFLKQLDPWKLYFLKSDIDEFMHSKDKIDDMVRQGDIRLGHAIFARFLERVDQRSALIETLLDMPHDFTVDEEMIVDRDALDYAMDDEEVKERWRQRIKYELLRHRADKLEPDKAVEKVRQRYRSIAKQWHQTDNDELLQTFLSAITAGFDPHSSYMSASSLENFQISMRLELDGIGASLRYVDGYTVVHKIIPGGAADKDGRLKPEDKVVSVGQGTEGEMVDVIDMKLTDVVQLIRGARGTTVRLGVIPSDSDQVQIYPITRARIELTDSEAKGEVMEVGMLPDGTPIRVGVLVLPSFYMDMNGASQGLTDFKSTTRDVKRLLDEFRQKDVDAVVIDLRGNGGGSLTEAINLTGLFIDDGPVVQVKGFDGRVQPYEDSEAGMTWSGPLVVVIDKFSASASEIFAGAIQDYGRGIVVGDRTTHGKGTVQQLFDLGRLLFRPLNQRLQAPNYGALKITIQQFYRPSGDSTQNRGVVSDVELPSLTTHWDIGEADLDYALAFDQVNSVPHTRYELVDPAMVQQLKSRSGERVQKSEDFKKLQLDISRYLERKERKKVTLNEAKFLAERAEFDNEKEEEKHFDELSDPGQASVKRDFYLDEVLSITSDYVQALEQNKVARRS